MTQQRRGAKPGTVQVPWTEPEWQILTAHLLDPCRQASRAIQTLSPLLPGRSPANIHNGLNRVRLRLCHLCSCGRPSPDGKKCPACLQAVMERRAERLKHGCCTRCGVPLGQGASATLCQEHRIRKQSTRGNDLIRHRIKNPRSECRPRNDPTSCHRIIPWPACGHARWIAQVTAATGRPVIDLCGGTGEQLRLVTVYGGNAFGYYDLDATMTALVAYAVATANAPRQPWPIHILPASTAPGTLKERKRRLRVLGRALQGTRITCQDALDTVAQTGHPPNAIFLADPPWPDTKHPSTRRIDHARLMEGLLNLPAGQDFVLSLGSERQALILAAKYMDRGIKLYWRTSGPYSVQSILCLSPALALHLEDTIGVGAIGRPICPATYGAGPALQTVQ